MCNWMKKNAVVNLNIAEPKGLETKRGRQVD